MTTVYAKMGSTVLTEWTGGYAEVDELVSAPDDGNWAQVAAGAMRLRLKILAADVTTGAGVYDSPTVQFRWDAKFATSYPRCSFTLVSGGETVGATKERDMETNLVITNGQLTWTGVTLTETQMKALELWVVSVPSSTEDGDEPDPYVA